jgi:hypothetical protein
MIGIFAGVDVTKKPIPVHYSTGGIATTHVREGVVSDIVGN